MVRVITALETHALRLPILRAGLPPESAIFPGDDDPRAQHFGAFDAGELVGVVTIFPAPLPEAPDLNETWQLRGMATRPEVRGRGYGKELVRHCVEHVQAQGGRALWCNARSPAAPFYQRLGWRTLGAQFEIPTAGPHLRMWLDLQT